VLRRSGCCLPCCAAGPACAALLQASARLFDGVAPAGPDQIAASKARRPAFWRRPPGKGCAATALKTGLTLPIGPASETTGSGQSELPCRSTGSPVIACSPTRDRGVPVPAIALAFHQHCPGWLVALPNFSDTLGERRLLLAGGASRIRLLLGTRRHCPAAGRHRALWAQGSFNDGGLALGQLLAAVPVSVRPANTESGNDLRPITKKGGVNPDADLCRSSDVSGLTAVN